MRPAQPVFAGRALCLASFCIILWLLGCAPRQASKTQLFSEWNARCKEAADLLETVHDAPTAKAAGPKLSAIMRQLHAIDEKLESSDDPEDEGLGDAPLVTKKVAEGIAQMQRLTMESVRVGQDDEIRAALGEAWQLLPAAAMMEAGVEFPPIDTPAP